MPDWSLDEQKRYNDAMIGLEPDRLAWDKKMDRLRNEVALAQREKNEARQNEVQTRIRLAKKPTLNYQPSKTFNDLRSAVIVALGIGGGLVFKKIS